MDKVYVIFHDHMDVLTDRDHDCDFFEKFVAVCKTEKEAQKHLGLFLLEHYYECCDYAAGEFGEPELIIDNDVEYFSADNGLPDKVTISQYFGNYDAYYYREQKLYQ